MKPHPSAKKRKAKQEDIDELLVKSLYSLQDSKKAKTEQMDEEEHYGQQIAHSLRRLNPRQKALAKIKIQELLFNIEFNPDPPAPTPYNSTESNYPNNHYHSQQNY